MTAFSPIKRTEALNWSQATRAMLDRHETIRRRTARIVDRLLPEFPQPNVSSRYPELNGTTAAWLRWERRCAERNKLRGIVRALIEARISAADDAVRPVLDEIEAARVIGKRAVGGRRA